MIDVRVANVGDGACAAVYSGGGRRLAAIIDCGSTPNSQDAVEGLRRIVDLPVRRPTTIIITHLHADHYAGLVNLARGARSPRFQRVELIQARLPRSPQLSDFTSRFFALEVMIGDVTGLPDLDLAATLAPATYFGVRPTWVSRGDQIEADGHRFDVLWPPAELGPGLSVLVVRAVQAFDSLARENDQVADLLGAVRSEIPIEIPGSRDGGPFDTERFETVDVEVDEDGDQDPHQDEDDFGAALHGTFRSVAPVGFNDRDRALLIDATRAFRRAANYMSLVLATPSRDFVAWGDAPNAVVRGVERSDPVIPGQPLAPRISLAPHHGSHGPNSLMGHPTVCVSSGGPRMYVKWAAKHANCPALYCLNTHVEGDLWFA